MMSSPHTQLARSYSAYAETHVELLEAVANELAVGNYAGAATALERIAKGAATIGVAVRNEANRKAEARG